MSSNNKQSNQLCKSITALSISRLFEGKNFAFIATTLMDGGYPQVIPSQVDINENNGLDLISITKVESNIENISKTSISVISHLTEHCNSN
jgi:hypothetical protein